MQNLVILYATTYASQERLLHFGVDKTVVDGELLDSLSQDLVVKFSDARCKGYHPKKFRAVSGTILVN